MAYEDDIKLKNQFLSPINRPFFNKDVLIDFIVKAQNAWKARTDAINSLKSQVLNQWEQLGATNIGGGISLEDRAQGLAARLYANKILDLTKLGLGNSAKTQVPVYSPIGMRYIDESGAPQYGQWTTNEYSAVFNPLTAEQAATVRLNPNPEGGGWEYITGYRDPTASEIQNFLTYGDRQIGFLGDIGTAENWQPTGYLQPGNLASWGAQGEGAVSYTVQQAPNGQVYFIPSWGSTSDLGSIAPILGIGLGLLAPGIGSAIGSALAPAASAAVQSAIGSAIIGGTMAEATGGDFLKGAVTSAIGSGIGSATAPVTAGISEAVGSQALGQALAGGAMAELQGGDFVQGAIQGGLSGAINDAKLAAAEEYLKSIPPAYTYESDLPTLNVVPGDTVGIVEAPITVDTSFTPDYSLSPVTPVIPEMGAQGIQVPTINEVIDVVNQPVDYSLPVPTTNVGLVIPTTPNIESMGGGQGITVPVTGGTLTEAGVIPETYVPVLGDETSFINQPAPDVSVNIPEIVEQPKDISGELAALDAAKALLPLAAGALTAGAVVNAIQEDQPTGFEIVPIPADWRSPEYNMAFTPSAPIDFGTAELLRGTQWQNPQIQAPKQYSISDVINALNYQSAPFVQQNYEIPQAQMTVPDILEQFNVKPTVGVNDIIGNLGGRPMSISDIIAGIQSGQTYSI